MRIERLLFVRHGESEHHVKGLTGGSTDLPLTPRGRRQAVAAAARLATLLDGEPATLFSSDLVRAAETAAIVARSLHVDVEAAPGLRELDNGAAAGLTSAEALRIETPLTAPVLDWVPYPRAESWRVMATRVRACLHGLDPRTPIAVIVGHQGSGCEVLKGWLGIDVEFLLEIMLAPCSVSELRRTTYGEPCIVRINDTAHLKGI